MTWKSVGLAVGIGIACSFIDCATERHATFDAQEHGALDATHSAELHGEEQVFTRRLEGEGEIERGEFAPLPDGGVYLVKGTRAKIGPKTTTRASAEAWQASSSGVEHAEEQTTVKADSSKSMKPALSCAIGGWLWALAAIAAALFAWRLLRRTT